MAQSKERTNSTIIEFIQKSKSALAPALPFVPSALHFLVGISDGISGYRYGALYHLEQALTYGAVAAVPYLLSNNRTMQNLYSSVAGVVLAAREGTPFGYGGFTFVSNLAESHFRGPEDIYIRSTPPKDLSDSVDFGLKMIKANRDIENPPKEEGFKKISRKLI